MPHTKQITPQNKIKECIPITNHRTLNTKPHALDIKHHRPNTNGKSVFT